MTCPRCGVAAADAQEYCLSCGARLPGLGRFRPAAPSPRSRLVPLLVTLAAAAGGAVAAIAATHDRGAPAPTVVALGGSVTVAAGTTVASSAAPGLIGAWPDRTDAWTIVLASIPKSQGRKAAVVVATDAIRRRLPRVGILDSSRVGSLHPGYWVVFTGVYAAQPDATGALQDARAVAKTARVQRVSS